MAISASHLDLWLHWIRTKTRTPLVALFKSISGQTRQTDLITVWISEQLRSSKINKEIWILGTTSIFDPLWKWLEPVRRHWQHSTNRNKLHIHSTSNKLLLACLTKSMEWLPSFRMLSQIISRRNFSLFPPSKKHLLGRALFLLFNYFGLMMQVASLK